MKICNKEKTLWKFHSNAFVGVWGVTDKRGGYPLCVTVGNTDEMKYGWKEGHPYHLITST